MKRRTGEISAGTLFNNGSVIAYGEKRRTDKLGAGTLFDVLRMM